MIECVPRGTVADAGRAIAGLSARAIIADPICAAPSPMLTLFPLDIVIGIKYGRAVARPGRMP